MVQVLERKTAIPLDMPKAKRSASAKPATATRQKVRPHPKWLAQLVALYDDIDHGGQRAAIEASGGKGGSAVTRLRKHPEQLGYDKLERVRVALNRASRRPAEEHLPPAVMSVRSREHADWCERGEQLDATGRLSVFVEWCDLAERMMAIENFDEVSTALHEVVEARERAKSLEAQAQDQLETSNDKLLAVIRRELPEASDLVGTTAHGDQRPRDDEAARVDSTRKPTPPSKP